MSWHAKFHTGLTTTFSMLDYKSLQILQNTTNCGEGYRANFDLNSFSDWPINQYHLPCQFLHKVYYNIEYVGLQTTSDTTKSSEETLQTHTTSCIEGYRPNFDPNSSASCAINWHELVYQFPHKVDYNIQHARLQITKHYNLPWRLQCEFQPELFRRMISTSTWPGPPNFIQGSLQCLVCWTTHYCRYYKKRWRDLSLRAPGALVLSENGDPMALYDIKDYPSIKIGGISIPDVSSFCCGSLGWTDNIDKPLALHIHYKLYWRLQCKFRCELFFRLCHKFTWPSVPIFI